MNCVAEDIIEKGMCQDDVLERSERKRRVSNSDTLSEGTS